MASKMSRSSAPSAPKVEAPFLAALSRASRPPDPGSLLKQAQKALRCKSTQRVYCALLRRAAEVRRGEHDQRPARMPLPPLCLPPVA